MGRIASLLLLLIPLAVAPAIAGVDGSDFDSMPNGPYPGPVLEGAPGNVQIRQVSSGTAHEAPLPPGATGKMLCIDAVGKAGRIIMEFTFACDIFPSGVCEVEYDYSVAQWYGDGVEVHIDPAGDYSDPDDVIDIPVGIPPSTTRGDNTETEGACDGSSHTLTFVVMPGSILYVDNLGTTCQVPTPARRQTWGGIKTIYR